MLWTAASRIMREMESSPPSLPVKGLKVAGKETWPLIASPVSRIHPLTGSRPFITFGLLRPRPDQRPRSRQPATHGCTRSSTTASAWSPARTAAAFASTAARQRPDLPLHADRRSRSPGCARAPASSTARRCAATTTACRASTASVTAATTRASSCTPST